MADWGTIAGIGAQTAAGLYGESQAKKQREEELRMLRESLAQYDGIELPDSSPEQLGPSAYEGIQADPETRGAQMEALASLQELIRGGGMTLTDKANLASVQNRTAQAEKSAREGIRENMAARGISGGGSELAMQLSAQQGAANRASSAGLETAAMAQKRALDAMLARGRLAGDVRGQDFGEKSRGAEAADAIARYNAASRASAKQQGYANQMGLAGAKAGARAPVAGYYGDQAQDTQKLYGGFGLAAAEAGRAYDANRETAEERAARLKRQNGGA